MDHSGQNSATVPYIGSKISLISNVDIRYEGVLYSIDTFESTVALQNVRSFGTEGRRAPEILPNDKTYQFIIFKGKDIKDLTVCEPAISRTLDDPAVLSVNVPPATPSNPMMHGNQQQIQSPTMNQGGMMGQSGDVPQGGYGPNRGIYGMAGGRGMNNYGPQGVQGRMPGYPHMSQQHMSGGGSLPVIRSAQGSQPLGFGRGGVEMYQPRARGTYGVMDHMDNYMGGMPPGRVDPRYGGRGGAGRGRGGGARRIVGELPPQPNQAVKKEVSKAFDFESSNAKFDKSELKTETVITENGTETEKPAKKSGYNKDASFFDHISCDTLDRAAGTDARLDRDKQRQLDCETFGAAAAAPRGRGFRRGYRRGGGSRRGGMSNYGAYGNRPMAPRPVAVNNYL